MMEFMLVKSISTDHVSYFILQSPRGTEVLDGWQHKGHHRCSPGEEFLAQK